MSKIQPAPSEEIFCIELLIKILEQRHKICNP